MKKKFAILMTELATFSFGFFLGGKMLVSMINDYKRRMQRNQSNMLVFNDWLEFLYSGSSVTDFFHTRGYSRIMIYGNSYIGARLVQALSGTDIEVTAIMDKEAASVQNGVIVGTDSKIPDVDCIVVTPVFYYSEILSMLQKKTDVPIISIEEIWKANERVEKDV